MRKQGIVGVPALLIASGLLAAATAAEQGLSGARIVVHDTYYAVGQSTFGDLDALALAVRPAAPRWIELGACGRAANRALLAAAHRFRDLPQALQVFDAGAAPCTADASAVRGEQPQTRRPTGIDDASVDRYWSQVAP